MDDLGAGKSVGKSRSGEGDLDASSDLENYESEHFINVMSRCLVLLA